MPDGQRSPRASSTRARSIMPRRSWPTLCRRRLDISSKASAHDAGRRRPISTTSPAPPLPGLFAKVPSVGGMVLKYLMEKLGKVGFLDVRLNREQTPRHVASRVIPGTEASREKRTRGWSVVGRLVDGDERPDALIRFMH